MNKENRWIVFMFIMTFILSMLFSGLSTAAIENMNAFLALILLLVVIFIGVVFDIIGMAVATCDEAPFNAKASKKIKGAKETLKLLKEKCGIISGSVGALISIKLATILSIDPIIPTLITGGLVASLTVGTKAIGKRIGIKNAEKIMEIVGKTVAVFKPIK